MRPPPAGSHLRSAFCARRYGAETLTSALLTLKYAMEERGKKNRRRARKSTIELEPRLCHNRASFHPEQKVASFHCRQLSNGSLHYSCMGKMLARSQSTPPVLSIEVGQKRQQPAAA